MPLRAVACTPSTATSVPISGRKATLMTKPGVSEVETLAPTKGKFGKGRGREGRLKQPHDYLTPGNLVIMCLLQEHVGICMPPPDSIPSKVIPGKRSGCFPVASEHNAELLSRETDQVMFLRKVHEADLLPPASTVNYLFPSLLGY